MKVLFPTDFSETANHAWKMAATVARAYNAELVILHVVDPPPKMLKLISEFDEELAYRHARNALDKFMKDNPLEGVEVSRMVKIGKPFKKVSEACNEIDPAVLIMGTQGASGLDNQFIGSTTRRVLKLATCPVIAVPNLPIKAFQPRLLLPLDLTRPVQEKVGFAIKVAKQFQATLFVISVAPENPENLEHLQTKMETVVNRIRDNHIKVESEILFSPVSPGEAIHTFAIENEIGMICMMTQREHGWKDILLGSTATHLMHYSSVPVMAIRPKTIYQSRRAGSVFG